MGVVYFVHGQNNIPKVTESQVREKLKERLRIFLDFQKERNYQELYEMLAKEQKNGSGTKESFVKIYQTSEKIDERLTNFIAKDLGLFQPSNDFAVIFGCGEYTKNKRRKYYESQVEAVYENDDWYFRSLIGASVGLGTPLKKCKMPK